MKKRQGLLVVLGLILSGCSYDYFIKDELVVEKQRQLFEQLCQSPDRYFVKETVEVDGYLSVKAYRGCTLGWDPILRHGYRYAECVEGSFRDRSTPASSQVLYFTLEEKGSPKCEAGRQFLLTRESDRQSAVNQKNNYEREFKDVIGDQCLAIDIRNRISSQHAVYKDYFLIYKDKEYTREELTELLGGDSERERAKGVISVGEIKAMDLTNRKTIAQKVEYAFFPKGTLHRTHSVTSCGEEMPPWRTEEILKPR